MTTIIDYRERLEQDKELAPLMVTLNGACEYVSELVVKKMCELGIKELYIPTSEEDGFSLYSVASRLCFATNETLTDGSPKWEQVDKLKGETVTDWGVFIPASPAEKMKLVAYQNEIYKRLYELQEYEITTLKKFLY